MSSLLKKVFGASSEASSSSSSTSTLPPKSTTKSTSTTTTTTTTSTKKTKQTKTKPPKPPITDTVEITGPGSEPSTNKIWAGDTVPKMRPGMVPAIVGEEGLSAEEMARMGIVPQGRWVKVSSTTTVKKIQGKKVERKDGEKGARERAPKDESQVARDDDSKKGAGKGLGKEKEKPTK